MKIKKSKLEQIIKEETENIVMEEGWKESLAGAGEGLADLGRAFARGFMGNAPGDNPFSKGTYAAYGVAFVPRIDKIFKKLFQEIKEFKSHEESDQLVDPEKGPQGSKSADVLMREFEQSLLDISETWIKMTVKMRNPNAQDEDPGEEEDPETYDVDTGDEDPEQGELPLSEVIRRQVRAALKKRLTF